MFLGVQIFSLIVGAGIVGAWGMYHWLVAGGYVETKQIAKQRKIWEKERYDQQKNRCRFIYKWAMEKMNSVPTEKLRTMDRKILVTYEELLKIWDISDKIEDNL